MVQSVFSKPILSATLLTFEVIGNLVVISILSPVDVPESLNEQKLRRPMKCENLDEETSQTRCDKKDVIAVISLIESEWDWLEARTKRLI